MPEYVWQDLQNVGDKHYKCGYCGHETAPNKGYYSRGGRGTIYICPNCSKPTFFDIEDVQTPKIRLGNEVGGISDKDVESLYNEARDCTSAGAYTAAVMICRKILMNFAVAQKAKIGEKFSYYVTYLSDNGYIPPQGKAWVDQIRQRGNDANHEIMLMQEDDANLILHFTEALLRFNYELPGILAADAAKKAKPVP